MRVPSYVVVFAIELNAYDVRKIIPPHGDLTVQYFQALPGCENVLGGDDWTSALANASKLLGDDRTVKWFPEYGCALFAVGKSTVSGGPIEHRTLSIVGCDSWTFTPRWIPPR